jgi:hypothetical protein
MSVMSEAQMQAIRIPGEYYLPSTIIVDNYGRRVRSVWEILENASLKRAQLESCLSHALESAQSMNRLGEFLLSVIKEMPPGVKSSMRRNGGRRNYLKLLERLSTRPGNISHLVFCRLIKELGLKFNFHTKRDAEDISTEPDFSDVFDISDISADKIKLKKKYFHTFIRCRITQDFESVSEFERCNNIARGSLFDKWYRNRNISLNTLLKIVKGLGYEWEFVINEQHG